MLNFGADFVPDLTRGKPPKLAPVSDVSQRFLNVDSKMKHKVCIVILCTLRNRGACHTVVKGLELR